MDKDQRAAEANFLLNHPLVREALDAIEADIVAKFKSCPLKDRDGQHELTLMLQLKGRFEQEFRTHIETGKLSDKPRTVVDSAAAYVKRLKELATGQ